MRDEDVEFEHTNIVDTFYDDGRLVAQYESYGDPLEGDEPVQVIGTFGHDGRPKPATRDITGKTTTAEAPTGLRFRVGSTEFLMLSWDERVDLPDLNQGASRQYDSEGAYLLIDPVEKVFRHNMPVGYVEEIGGSVDAAALASRVDALESALAVFMNGHIHTVQAAGGATIGTAAAVATQYVPIGNFGSTKLKLGG